MMRVGCGGMAGVATLGELVVARLEGQRQRVVVRVRDRKTGACVLPCEQASIVAAIAPTLLVETKALPASALLPSDEPPFTVHGALPTHCSAPERRADADGLMAPFYGPYELQGRPASIISMPTPSENPELADALRNPYSVWSLAGHSSLHDGISELTMTDIGRDELVYQAVGSHASHRSSHGSSFSLGVTYKQLTQPLDKDPTEFGFEEEGGQQRSPYEEAFRSLYACGLLEESTRSLSETLLPGMPPESSFRGDALRTSGRQKRPREASQPRDSSGGEAGNERLSPPPNLFTPQRAPVTTPVHGPARYEATQLTDRPHSVPPTTATPYHSSHRTGEVWASALDETCIPSTMVGSHLKSPPRRSPIFFSPGRTRLTDSRELPTSQGAALSAPPDLPTSSATHHARRHRSPVFFTPRDIPSSSSSGHVSGGCSPGQLGGEGLMPNVLTFPDGTTPGMAARRPSALAEGMLTMTPPSSGSESPGLVMTQQALQGYVYGSSSDDSGEDSSSRQFVFTRD